MKQLLDNQMVMRVVFFAFVSKMKMWLSISSAWNISAHLRGTSCPCEFSIPKNKKLKNKISE